MQSNTERTTVKLQAKHNESEIQWKYIFWDLKMTKIRMRKKIISVELEFNK